VEDGFFFLGPPVVKSGCVPIPKAREGAEEWVYRGANLPKGLSEEWV
jgi:hypothetical protein